MKDKNYESNDKMVSHPPHYQSETGLEVIDCIEAFTFDLKGIEAVDTGNVLKYICRWKQKNGVQDLKKAMWYLQHLINHVEKLEEENKPIVKSGRYPWGYARPSGDLFETYDDAAKVAIRLNEVIREYGSASVADLKDLLGNEPDYRDCHIGWTEFMNPVIEQDPTTGKFYVILPEPVDLKKN